MNKHTAKTKLLTSISLLKIALATKEKSTVKQICASTELSEAYVNKILKANPNYFQFTGYCEESPRALKQHRVKPLVIETIGEHINDLQGKFDSEELPELLPMSEPQVVYKNSYDQLSRDGHMLDCKIGRIVMFSEKHNVRMSGKTRNFVSGATLSWI